MTICYPIPIIDLFAGPGGLSEGFASIEVRRNKPAFDIMLSIEKDPYAHATLELRSFFRHIKRNNDPADYYRYLRDCTTESGVDRNALFAQHPESAEYARSRAWHKELSPRNRAFISRRIRKALDQYPRDVPWVLLGGPPCQAYSLVGRSRMRRVMGARFEKDDRHRLYEEYLAILSTHRPHAFVMENVKGILSSQLKSKRVFDQILRDLCDAGEKDSYTLFSLVERHNAASMSSLFDNNGYHHEAADFLIESEKYGIPQARHRVIILGLRSDLLSRKPGFSPGLLKRSTFVQLSQVLCGLPRLRSGRTEGLDSNKHWEAVLQNTRRTPWFHDLNGTGDAPVKDKIRNVLANLRMPQAGRGGRFVRSNRIRIQHEKVWFLDDRVEGICNHETRPHMDSDLHRYLFASCFASVHKRTAKLGDFPSELLPAHANVHQALGNGMFNDRFRVQVSGLPATTITCHLSRDGHYAIHYDPSQCRSLTVREAARIQTFPDNYFFEGPRTQQYVQVGNAVPPLLAKQIAEIVLDTLQAFAGR